MEAAIERVVVKKKPIKSIAPNCGDFRSGAPQSTASANTPKDPAYRRPEKRVDSLFLKTSEGADLGISAVAFASFVRKDVGEAGGREITETQWKIQKKKR